MAICRILLRGVRPDVVGRWVIHDYRRGDSCGV